MQFTIEFKRKTTNRLNEDTTKKTLKDILSVAERNNSLGFKSIIPKNIEPILSTDENGISNGYDYIIECKLKENKAETSEIAQKRFEYLYEIIQKRANQRGWNIGQGKASYNEDGGQSIIDSPELVSPRPAFLAKPLTEDVMSTFFDGIYERESHIRLIHDSVCSFINSGSENRSHTILFGLPAACKTTMFERFKQWYEQDEEIERVVFIDGPTTSKAGLENWFLSMTESNILPEIIVIEEVEKQPLENLLCLLSIMGSGYISKTNAKIGRVKRECRCLIWATCNNRKSVQEFRDGALWSRFTHRFHCPRPSAELMELIVHNKVKELGGSYLWAEAALDLAKKCSISDPRQILGLLDGGNRLLDGSYQKDYMKVFSSEGIENLRSISNG